MSYLKISSVSVVMLLPLMPELARRMEQRLADFAADHDGARLGRTLDDLFPDRVAGERQLDAMGVVAVVAEAAQLAVDRQVERQLGAGLELRQRLLDAGMVEQALQVRRRDVQFFEQHGSASGRVSTLTICQLSPECPRSRDSGQLRQRQRHRGALRRAPVPAWRCRSRARSPRPARRAWRTGWRGPIAGASSGP